MNAELINTINSLPIEDAKTIQLLINRRLSNNQEDKELSDIKKELILKLKLTKN